MSTWSRWATTLVFYLSWKSWKEKTRRSYPSHHGVHGPEELISSKSLTRQLCKLSDAACLLKLMFTSAVIPSTAASRMISKTRSSVGTASLALSCQFQRTRLYLKHTTVIDILLVKKKRQCLQKSRYIRPTMLPSICKSLETHRYPKK